MSRPESSHSSEFVFSSYFPEKRLAHREDAETFLLWRMRRCESERKPAGTRASSNDSWPSRSLSCGLEMRTRRVREQKTDRQDAQLILRLLLEDRFPADLGCRSGRLEICDNCCGTATAWSRRVPGS